MFKTRKSYNRDGDRDRSRARSLNGRPTDGASEAAPPIPPTGASSVVAGTEGTPGSREPVFTVFTPTWNRADTLPRLFQSLRAQTFDQFEWLIVDDGSSDDTLSLLEQCAAEAPFPVRVIRQPHAGKAAAFTRGVAEARGRLFFAIDSDDTCTTDALACLLAHWENIPNVERAKFVGVTGLACDPAGRVIGDRFPDDVVDCSYQQMRYEEKVKGDKLGFQRTDVLRMFSWPQVEDGSFVPEGILWGSIGHHYRTRYVNDIVETVWPDASGGRLTSADPAPHAAGMALWHRWMLNEELAWFRYDPCDFLRSAAHYVRFSLHDGQRLSEQPRRLKTWRARGLWAMATPIGIAIYVRDRRRSGSATRQA